MAKIIDLDVPYYSQYYDSNFIWYGWDFEKGKLLTKKIGNEEIPIGGQNLNNCCCQLTCLAMVMRYSGIHYNKENEEISPHQILVDLLGPHKEKVENDIIVQAPKDRQIYEKLLGHSDLKMENAWRMIMRTEAIKQMALFYSIPEDKIEVITTGTVDNLKDYIDEGYPVIICYGILNPNAYQGHFAVVRGYTNDGHYIINDPVGNPTNGGKSSDDPGRVIYNGNNVDWSDTTEKGGERVFIHKDDLSAQHFGKNAFVSSTIIKIKINETVYPLQKKDTEKFHPLSFYFNAETNKTGYYPAGIKQTLHGGVHLPAITNENTMKLVPVKSMASGYIAAARLGCKYDMIKESDVKKKKENDKKLYNIYDFIGNYIGFVLIKHEIDVIADRKKGISSDQIPLYSLYMHLTPFVPPEKWPNTQEETDKIEIKWFKELFTKQFYINVNIDKKSSEFGKKFWTETSQEDENKVISRKLKKADEFAKALKNLGNGEIITFGDPLIKVKAGETIGYAIPECNLTPVITEPEAALQDNDEEGDNKFGGYIHWEIFAPKKAGETSGVEKIKDLYSKIFDDELKKFKEFDKDDNFLQIQDYEKLGKLINDLNIKNDFPKFTKSLTDVEKIKIKSDKIGPANRNLKLIESFFKDYFRHNSKTFYSGSSDKIDFYLYPFKLKFKENPNVIDKNHKVRLEYFNYENKKIHEVYNTDGKYYKIKDIYNNGNGLELKVPVNASTLRFECDGYYIEEIKFDEKTKKGEIEKEIDLFRDFIKYRFRNVLLDHKNEWTANAAYEILKTLDKNGILALSKDQSIDDIYNEQVLQAWWKDKKKGNKVKENHVAQTEKGETSLFNSFLPTDARIHNINPITALWMLDILSRNNNISILKNYEKKGENAPFYYSVFFPDENIKYGQIADLIVMGNTYKDDENLKITIKNDKKLIEVPVIYDEHGIFKFNFTTNFWGDCTVESSKESQKKGNVSFKIEKPKIGSLKLEKTKERNKFKIIFDVDTIKQLDKGPNPIEGLLYLKYKKHNMDLTEEELKQDINNWTISDDPIPIMFNVHTNGVFSGVLDITSAFDIIASKSDGKPDNKQNEIVSFAYAFIVPNGNLDELKETEIEDYNNSTVNISFDKAKSNGYSFGFDGEESEEEKFILLDHKLGFTGFGNKMIFTMSKKNLRASVKCYGDIFMAQPKINCNGKKIVYSSNKENTNVIWTELPLFESNEGQPYSDWPINNKSLTFKTELTENKDSFNVKTIEQSITPKYEFNEKLIITIMEENDLFYFWVLGHAITMPMDKPFQLSYKKIDEDENSWIIVKNKSYTCKKGSTDQGTCNNNGLFEAKIIIEQNIGENVKTGKEKYIFQLKRIWGDNMIFSNKIKHKEVKGECNSQNYKYEIQKDDIEKYLEMDASGQEL